MSLFRTGRIKVGSHSARFGRDLGMCPCSVNSNLQVRQCDVEDERSQNGGDLIAGDSGYFLQDRDSRTENEYV